MDIIILCGAAIGMFFLLYPNYDLIYTKEWWGIICMIFCCLMASGQVWNEIQNPPFFNINLLLNMESQCVVETFVVMMLYGGFIFGMIMMIEAASNKDNSEKRSMQATSGVTIAMFFFSLLVIMFRSKAGA